MNEEVLNISEKEECLRAKVYIRDFTNPNKQVRHLALNQIKKLSKPIAQAVLKKLLFQQESQVKQIEVLGAFATCDGPIDGERGFLKSYVFDPNPEIRLAALRVISKYEDEECFEILSTAAQDPQTNIRREAINMLCRIYGNRALPLLLHLLHDLDDGVRKSAITLCSSFATTQAVPVLIPMLADENTEIQQSVHAALQKITGHSIDFDLNGTQESKNKTIQTWNSWWMEHQV